MDKQELGVVISGFAGLSWRWLKRNWLRIAALCVIASVLAAEAVFVAVGWPNNWKPAAQATLAGALIAVAGTSLSVLIKYLFDSITLSTKHRLAVRGKILETFYGYAGNHLMPLAGAAGELAKFLLEFQRTTQRERERVLDSAFYSLAQYVRLQSALIGTFAVPGADRPLGLFLKSREREARVWDIMMPPWVFGVRSIQDQFLLIRYLPEHEGDAGETTPAEFMRHSRDDTHPLFILRQAFEQSVDGHPHLPEIIDVLIVLSALIDYEVRSVYEAWYIDTEPGPSASIKVIKQIPVEVKESLGIFYRARLSRAATEDK